MEKAQRPQPYYRAAQLSLLLLIASQPLMSVLVQVGRSFAIPADALYLLTAALTAIAIMRREIVVRWHKAYWLLLFYFAAMALSALLSQQPLRGAFKLATQIYLLSLPMLTFNLVRDERDMCRTLKAWLWTGAVVGLLGLVTLALWLVDASHPLVVEFSHPKGTLAEGDYPRLDISFTHAAMLANYLTVSVAVLLAVAERGWIGRRLAPPLLAAMVVTAFFSMTPGLAGLWLGLGFWTWMKLRTTRRTMAWLALAVGAAGALPYLVAAALTPFPHSTATFALQLPVGTLYPGARLLFWIAAFKNLVANLPFGSGIGTDAIAVPFQNPAGHLYTLSDAHNVFLNLGVQTGLPGILALVLIISFVARKVFPLPRRIEGSAAIRLGLGLGWLNAFAVQGLVGSFEDARFLWLLFGLFLASTARPASSRISPLSAVRQPETWSDAEPPAGAGTCASGRSQ
ncbi:MAG TPA: hypothetical protein VHM92_13820 [Allosphingosinicella sp.]|nr:hypothetical protein [Allosphingosinicella sp.]